MKKVFKIIGFVFLGLFVLGVIGAMLGDPKPTASGEATAAAEPAKPPEPLMKTTARELAAAYDENTVAADAKYKGKRFSISGIVTDINTDFMGDPVILLRGGVNQFMEPQFSFDKSEAGEVAKIKKGITITIECRGKGDVAKTPMSDDCVFPASPGK